MLLHTSLEAKIAVRVKIQIYSICPFILIRKIIFKTSVLKVPFWHSCEMYNKAPRKISPCFFFFFSTHTHRETEREREIIRCDVTATRTLLARAFHL